MADFQTNVSNSLNLFGPAPSDKWNAYNWNAFLWGEGTAGLDTSFYKVLSETLTPIDTITKTPVRLVANTLSPTSDMTSEGLTDDEGYNRVFPGGVTNGEDRASPSWAAPTATTPTWTQGSASSTTWSGS